MKVGDQLPAPPPLSYMSATLASLFRAKLKSTGYLTYNASSPHQTSIQKLILLPSPRAKLEFWKKLGHYFLISFHKLDPYDFNEVLFPNERTRGGRISNSMRRFSDIMNDLDLRDRPLQGGPYTWRGGLNGSSMSCLDRFLVTAEWESHCTKVTQRCLPRPISDHFPILFDCVGVRTGPASFRFELMWLKYEGFKDILKWWWQNLHFYGSFSFILSAKLKALKDILKAWNRDVFGKVETNKEEALRRVSFWDDCEKVRVLTLEEAEERVKARADLKSWALMEEISWRQKSRETWLKEGDMNTHFFAQDG